MKIQTILDQIDLGAVALPEFQRGYVWNRDQVRGLMQSLYRKYPVGGLLVWTTKTESADARGDGQLTPGSVKLLLDGQQRITSLHGIIRGRPPKFFEGHADAFTGLYFHLEDEAFEFYAPVKMKENPLWINVTELMKLGAGAMIPRLVVLPEFQTKLTTYINRLNAVDQIKEFDLHIEEVTGEDKTVDVVVDIFNRVNSGGTKLSKGDLALAKICAAWPDARDEMKKRLDKWEKAGFNFRLEWLLRNINTILTGEALFSALKDVDTATFQQGLQQAEKAINTLLNLIAARLGLDHGRVLGGPSAIPVMTRYLTQRGGHFANHEESDKLLYWYIHSFLWGRHTGSTESVLNQDLDLIEQIDGGLDRLINQLRQNRGDLHLQPADFLGWSQSARFYPLLYMMTRMGHARDWETGVALSNHLLGHLNRLQLHHIFPKALLYKHGYSRPDVNALTNFTFLTQETNLLVSDRDPAEYLEEFVSKHPGAVESHWIPTDRDLWRIENYHHFLDARRSLLAAAANRLLDNLLSGSAPATQTVGSVLERTQATVPGGIYAEEEEEIIWQCNEWISQRGLPEGELLYEITDGTTGKPIAILDLAWPNGLQEGLSQPVALLINEGQETEEAANRAGFRYFTDLEAFRAYVERDVLALEPAGT
ncbi:MAG: GmrSD restriction endonuclease domain-containing protein [Dehalococcoidia bacterium]